MKKALLLLPLLLCSCSPKCKIYENVGFYWDNTTKTYVIEVIKNEYEIIGTYTLKPENVYYISVLYYSYRDFLTKDGSAELRNEFYTNPKKLYVYQNMK